MATKTEIRKYRKEWLKFLKRADTIDNPAVKEVFDLLKESRIRIADRIISAEGFDKFRMTSILRSIDEVFAEFDVRASEVLAKDIVSSFDFGVDMFDEPFRFAGASKQINALPMISREALESQLERGSQFITNLSSDSANKIKAEITLGLTGEKTQADVMREIGRTIKKGRFSSISARAETIVRTEINSALNTATLKRAQQATNELQGMRKFWMTANDRRVRDSHSAVESQTRPSEGGTPIPMRQNFHLSGRSAKGPHDPNLKAKDLINCFPGDVSVVGNYNSAMRGFYNGKILKIKTNSGSLTVTPNHPILTEVGFIPARLLDKGNKMVRYVSEINNLFRGENINHKPTTIKKLFGSFGLLGGGESRLTAATDFYGDGRYFDGNIDIVYPERILGKRVKSILYKHVINFFLMRKNSVFGTSHRDCMFDLLPVSSFSSFGSFPGAGTLSLNELSVLFQSRPFESLGLATPPDANPFAFELSDQGISTNAREVRNLFHRLTGLIELDPVIDISVINYNGHVYDLQSDLNIILANNYICSNCRCRLGFDIEKTDIIPNPLSI